MLWARSTTKDYIKAEHKLHSTSKLFISQVIIPQVILVSSFVGALSSVSHEGLHKWRTQTSFYLKFSHFTSHYTTSHAFIFFFSLFIYHRHSTREPASSKVTYFILRAYKGTVLAAANTGKTWERFWKKNAGEWTGRVEIGKEEIHGSKRSMYGYIVTYSGL